MAATAEVERGEQARPGSQTRVKTPTVLQMQVTECGAASLGMVLGHYGCWVSLEDLRERCGASRDGTTASDLVKTSAQSWAERTSHTGMSTLPLGSRRKLCGWL